MEWWAKESSVWFAAVSVIGPLTAILMWNAQKGWRRAFVVAAWTAVEAVSGALAAMGLLALAAGQPPYVWMPLIVSGGVTGVVYHFTRSEVKGLYRQAELRRIAAKDL